jgi:hypothetical protein
MALMLKGIWPLPNEHRTQSGINHIAEAKAPAFVGVNELEGKAVKRASS